jgi:hypothetical protein
MAIPHVPCTMPENSTGSVAAAVDNGITFRAVLVNSAAAFILADRDRERTSTIHIAQRGRKRRHDPARRRRFVDQLCRSEPLLLHVKNGPRDIVDIANQGQIRWTCYQELATSNL